MSVESEPGYYANIKPIFAIHCLKCHSSETEKGGLRLDISDRAIKGGKSGKPAIAPGDPGLSELVRRIASHDPDEQMPRGGPRLDASEVALIKRWIENGAKWPNRDDHWAFVAPVKPAVPRIALLPSKSNPIDSFIMASLKSSGIEPNPIADARTLLRRAFFDLVGVPPSPEEADAFLSDPGENAYEKLINRLLNDPRYGERWGRHWLDIARYGESDGYEDDKIRPHAWRYRDYVIRSLNDDKPYDHFVAEQIAGDQLWPGDPDAWIATGFQRVGAWDGMSKDPPRQRQDFLNDITDTLGSSLLGLTIGCARCHDHKYDPVTQRDYYRLQAFFAGVKRESRELHGDLHDPPFIKDAAQRAHVEIQDLTHEREAILLNARMALQQEIAARSESPQDKEPVAITDNQVRAKAQKMEPARLGQIKSRLDELGELEALNGPMADVCFEDSPRAPKTVILKGGELSRRGEEVAPGFIEIMCPPGEESPGIPEGSGRRVALARWLTSPQNPLLARVMVNRLWQHHFGTGLVATPSDFGRNGRPPTHPELLDYLACRFIEDGYSLKNMHRLIMLSATYRRASVPNALASAKDPDNKLLWRNTRRRLEAEAIRDTILCVSGQISPTMGGPGVYPKLPANVSVELPNNDKKLSWYGATDEENRRRSIYIFQRRSLTFPLIEVFDGAPMSQGCPARAMTTVAPQALALFNGEFSREAAAHLSRRLTREVGDDSKNQIDRAFRITMARLPTDIERALVNDFLTRQSQLRKTQDVGDADARAGALVDFCHVLLNSNELIHAD